MTSRLRRRLVDTLSEPTLRRVQRLRHGENLSLRQPVGRAGVRGVTPEIVTEFDAHAVRAEVARTAAARLDDAGVPYVLLPGPRGTVQQIAVEAAYRPAVLEVVDALAAGLGWAATPGLSRRGTADRLHVYRVLAAPTGHLLCGRDTSCEIAVWTREGRHLVAPRDNPVVEKLTAAAWEHAVASPRHWPIDDPLPYAFDVREPVDIVYTWVDGDDPEWQARKARYAAPGARHNFSAGNLSRYLNRDELRFSMRSVAMFAGWVRRIHLVTDNQVPDWLDASHPKINLVDHRDIFTDRSVLPVFNSHAIESQLQHIPDLAEQFLYCNDDFFFGRPVEPELFFHGNGIAKFFMSKRTLDLEPPSADDLPVTSAGKNNRVLLEREFGVTVRHKLQHTAYPLLRSVLVEMEKRHPEVFARVAASRFRHPDDLSIAAALHHYYAYARGRAVPGEVHYRYQDIGLPNTARRLDEFLRERPEVFCLNDLHTDPSQLEEQFAALRQFFDEYFPVAAPWERDA
jgi:Stealth protein CR2, conserved region 2/Stealth protein CR3, conserved region 3/Stealth protein CR1, conserved region 1/Stealth protein CR4, conserved region 4